MPARAMPPRYRRYAERFRQLIEEGKSVAKLEKPARTIAPFIQGEDVVLVHAWLTKSQNILEIAFGADSSHVQSFNALTAGREMSNDYEIYPVVGVLQGALDDLENGYLLGQEFFVAGNVFDSVLDQAQHLLEKQHKTPAAVLARVVLEDALKRIARAEEIDDDQKASVLNDQLKSAQRYAQPQWRLIQHWLDVGNAAAHGQSDSFSDEDVKRLIEDLKRFLATEFQA